MNQIRNLLWKIEEDFISHVMRTVENELVLNCSFLYVFSFDKVSGGFVKCDVVPKSFAEAYSREKFYSYYKRLYLSKDSNGHVFVFFDGKKIRKAVEFFEGKWRTTFFEGG